MTQASVAESFLKRAEAPRGVLLDVDGTLLDSNDAHAHAFAEAFREASLDISFARVRPLIGMGADKLLPALGIEASTRVGAHVKERKKEIFTARYLASLRPFPGARDLLLHMRKVGLARVVATSAGADELRDLLRAGGVDDLIETESTSSDAAASKPDPDIVEAAIGRSRLDRTALVMLGDTPYDVEAALRAGVRIVALRCGGWSDRDLANATAIYDDAADLLSRFDTSPLAP